MRLQTNFAAPASKSLEDIRNQIDAELPSNGRRDMRSALAFVVKRFGPLSDIDASPPAIHRLFASKNGPALGVSQKRYLNARSLIVRSLDRYGATPMKLMERFGRAPEWTALVEQVPDKNRRSAINRLACFCTAIGVGPNEITRDVLLAFHAAVASEQAIKDPRAILRNAMAYWNEASRKIPGWPQYILSSPFERHLVVLPEDQFPNSFAQDISRWVRRGAHPDPFEDDGLSRPLRAATLKAQERHVWRFASLLVRNEIISANTLVSLRALVNPELVKAGLKVMLEENDNVPSGHIANVASLLRKIAKYDVRLPPEELQQLEKFSARMSKGRNRTMTDANREKLALFDDPRVLAEFLSIPEKERRRVQRIGNAMRKAKGFERALVFEILYFSALRMQNLSTMNLDKNIQMTNGKTVLRFEGTEMKNHEALECELPDFVAQNLRGFVECHRPKLNGAGGRHLFPGRNGGHKHHSTLRAEFKKMVYRHLGQRLHPHFMRHLSTHIILQDDPSNLPLASIRLGHRSLETLTRAYADNPTRAASRKANFLLDQKPKPVTRGRKSRTRK